MSRALVVRVVIAALLLGGAFATYPALWTGDGPPPAPVAITTAELALGATLDALRRGVPVQPEWAELLEASAETRGILGELHGRPAAHWDGGGRKRVWSRVPAPAAADTRTSRLSSTWETLGRQKKGRTLPWASIVAEIAEALQLPVPVDASRLAIAMLHYLEASGVDHQTALTSACGFLGAYAQDGQEKRTARQLSWGLRGGIPTELQLRANSLRQRLEAQLAPSLELGSLAAISRGRRYHAAALGEIGLALLGALVVAWAWLLLALVVTRRRGGPAPGAAQGGARPWLLLLLPVAVVAWLLPPSRQVVTGSNWREPYVAGMTGLFLGLALGIVAGALCRAPRPGAAEGAAPPAGGGRRDGWASQLGMLVAVATFALVTAGAWRPYYGDGHGELAIQMSALEIAMLVIGGGLIALTFGHDPARMRARLAFAAVVLLVAATVAIRVFRLNSTAGVWLLMTSPLLGLLWLVAGGIVYWLVRRLYRGLDPRRVRAPWLVAGAILLAIVGPQPWYVIGPSTTLVITLAMGVAIVLFDAARLHAAPAHPERQVWADRTLAWALATGDGIVLGALAALGLAAGTRWMVAAQTAELSALLLGR